MGDEERRVTLRRSIEQAIHCLVEARSVLGNGEDPRCAADDVDQARELIRAVIIPGIAKMCQATSGEDHGTLTTSVRRS